MKDHGLIALCIGRSRTVILLLVLFLLAGSYAYVAIPKEAQPDITVPLIYVTVTHEGISPGDAERMLIRPIEKELRGIDGIKEVRSNASEGRAGITIEFEVGFDVTNALNEVRRRVDVAKAELPDDTDEPTVQEVNLALEPIIVVSLAGKIPDRALVRLARELRDALETIPEILEVEIGGDREEVLELVFDATLFDAHGIQLDEVFQFVTNNNVLIAAGAMENNTGRIPIKVPGLLEEPEDLLNLPVKAVEDRVIRVRDIATVHSTFKEPAGIARSNGVPAFALYVRKRVGENVVSAVDAVRATVAAQQKTWPEGVTATFSQDMSRYIREMLTDLQNNIISAVILVMLVVIGALGWRSGMLVGVAIPGSFLTGMVILMSMGLTVNIVVLFSLILSVGMLVDGAIVVVEFADRKMNEGLSRRPAYLLASQRMAGPIIASTATTLAAFMPLLFWPDVTGEFMKFMPITLIVTLSASLVMALVFLPVIGARFGRAGPVSADTMKHLAGDDPSGVQQLKGVTGAYVRTLRWALAHPLLVLVAALAIFISVLVTYGKLGQGTELFPDVDPDFATIKVRMRGNLSIYDMDRLVREVENEILEVDGIRAVNTRTNVRTAGLDVSEDTHGLIFLEFDDWRHRPPVKEILETIRRRTAHISGIIIEHQAMEAGPPQGKDIQIEISSAFPDRIEPVAAAIRHRLEEEPGLRDVDDSRPPAAVEWDVHVDRERAARFGTNVRMVGSAVQFLTAGLLMGTYRPDGVDDEVDIRARYINRDRHLSQIERMRLHSSHGLIPLSHLVTADPTPRVGSVDRIDGRRMLTVSANVEEGIVTSTKVDQLREWQENVDPPPGVSLRFRGEDEESRDSMAFLIKAFFVAIFVMAIILVTQFNSFYQTLLILVAVIFSTTGVFLGLLITGKPFGILMNGVGVIALAGIVVNNNIVLIDTFDYHFRRGIRVVDAILLTGAQRLRPVFLTTVTTVLGLVPMVMKMNIDFVTREVTFNAPSTQWWQQLAISIAFGLTFATALTLILTPTLLMLGRRLFEREQRRMHGSS